jgi:hypothetical protein
MVLSIFNLKMEMEGIFIRIHTALEYNFTSGSCEPSSSKSAGVGEVSLNGDSDPIPSERLPSEDAADASLAALHTALTASASAVEASINMSIDFLSVLKMMRIHLASTTTLQTLIIVS